MALKPIHSFLLISLIVLLSSTMIPSGNVHALTTDSNDVDQAPLAIFVRLVQNGHADQLRGLYIPEVLAAPVVTQPAGIDGFISPWQNVVTQFGFASRLGSTGLLAHADLAGKSFAFLDKGQEFYLIYGDGHIAAFEVSAILQYQALEPGSPSSSFIDLENNKILTSSELFTKMYARPGQVVLQTCIYDENNPTWGRLFVIAEPSSVK
jgi:hypothetical protein